MNPKSPRDIGIIRHLVKNDLFFVSYFGNLNRLMINQHAYEFITVKTAEHDCDMEDPPHTQLT